MKEKKYQIGPTACKIYLQTRLPAFVTITPPSS